MRGMVWLDSVLSKCDIVLHEYSSMAIALISFYNLIIHSRLFRSAVSSCKYICFEIKTNRDLHLPASGQLVNPRIALLRS